MPAEGHSEPSDEALQEAITHYLQKNTDPIASRYEYTRIDLNGDGKRDALVRMKTPYGHWCGEYGCSMIIFAAHKDAFTPVNKVHPVRPPLYISTITSHNWHDLIIHVSGRPAPEKAKNVALRFDGIQYPSTPENLPAYTQLSKNENIKVFP